MAAHAAFTVDRHVLRIFSRRGSHMGGLDRSTCMATPHIEFFSKPACHRPSRMLILRPSLHRDKLWRPAILVRESVRGRATDATSHRDGSGCIVERTLPRRGSGHLLPFCHALAAVVESCQTCSLIAGELPLQIERISRQARSCAVVHITRTSCVPSVDYDCCTAKMAPKWLKKNTLKNRDDQRTNASELTLRQSIYPIILVTILFFLWVRENSITQRASQKITSLHTLPKPSEFWPHGTLLTPNLPTGLLLRPPRHSKQTLPKLPKHHPCALLRSASRLLRRIPSRLAWSRQLDPAPLWLQSNFHLGPVLVWYRIARGMALHFEQIFWGFLRGDFHYWEWFGQFGDSGESVYYGVWAAEVFGDSNQFLAGF